MNFFGSRQPRQEPTGANDLATQSILHNVKEENKLLENVNTNLLQKIDRNEADFDKLHRALEAQTNELGEKSEALDKAQKIIMKLQQDKERAERVANICEGEAKELKKQLRDQRVQFDRQEWEMQKFKVKTVKDESYLVEIKELR